MYSDFTTDGFRGLGRLHLPRLTPVTVVTGRNDVGKSALLEAMFLHGCGPTAAIAGLQVLRPMRRLVAVSRDAEGRLNDPWAPFFAGLRPQRPIVLGATVDGTERRLELRPSSRSQGTVVLGPATGQAPPETSASVEVVVAIDGQPPTSYHQSVTLGATGSAASFTSDPEPVVPWSKVRIVKGVGAIDAADAFSTLRREQRVDDLLVGLRAVDPRIEGAELLMSEGVLSLNAHLTGGALLPFTALGDGLNSVATYLLSAAEARASLLLIDELEEGLHYSVLEDVWRALVATMRRNGGQLVVTTHSDACIAAAVAAMSDQPEDLSLVRLRGTQHDVARQGDPPKQPVEAVTYSGTRVADAVELDVEVR